MLKRGYSFPQGGKSLLRKKIVKRGLFLNGIIIRKGQCMRKKVNGYLMELLKHMKFDKWNLMV